MAYSKLIRTLGACSLFKYTRMTRWDGCQCFGDCNCKEDWRKAGNPKEITSYDVFTGRRTHSYNTLEEAEANMERIVKEQRLTMLTKLDRLLLDARGFTQEEREFIMETLNSAVLT